MTDKSYLFHHAGKQFVSHQSVYHMAKEHACNVKLRWIKAAGVRQIAFTISTLTQPFSRDKPKNKRSDPPPEYS